MLRPPNRAIGILFVCTAFASMGMFTAITLGAIAAVETGGSHAASGLPAALAIFGTATGSFLLGALVARSSWRVGLQLGWLIGALGGACAAFGVERSSFALVLVGMLAIGMGNGGTQLGRFAAARTVAPDIRSSAVAWAVWAATVGAVLGPLSIGRTGDLAERAGLEPGTGGFILVIGSLLAAAAVATMFRPVMHEATSAERAAGPAAARVTLLPTAISMVAAQACMVMVMAITPVHLHDGGHDYAVVGMVLSGHFVGMFALAPLVGAIANRVTTAQAIRMGLMTLGVGSLLAALMPIEHGTLLSLPLLLIGLGWCMCFVSASAGIATAVSGPRAQGRIDALVWLGAATASVVSGLVIAEVGYSAVAYVSMGSVLVVAALVAGRVDVREPQPST
jgi:MFS family permease